ncbi:hypothetical protein [Marinimicrobium sp. ABcell2]|uniref:hypothetical protein n=1 Tax=Marinimicrobium sp. ABcell2 TaxID=3069751 RepID=UPI0027B47784|nr:hypothetical protein [Marinimicrobium sp. ABcell2]MDQ2077375.1 hypothetical protein [Marinimicrobium sp. ABcell2]
MKPANIKERRERLRITQAALAEEVARLSGRTFSQQSLHKIEANPMASSRFMHHILAILDERESAGADPSEEKTIEYEQVMTLGNCGEIIDDPERPESLVGLPKPAPIPQPAGAGWTLVSAVPYKSQFIQYIWQRKASRQGANHDI